MGQNSKQNNNGKFSFFHRINDKYHCSSEDVDVAGSYWLAT